MGNTAVEATPGLVLLYDGRVVNAPYHANCGGTTAAPRGLVARGAEPYLRRVSDQIPGTDRFYCDRAPRFRWTRVYRRRRAARAGRALRARRCPAAPAGVGARDERRGDGRSRRRGRVGTLTVDTDRGSWSLRGNEIRSVLRAAGGELLYSTYFSVDVDVGAATAWRRSRCSGGGNGHGVGMCQSGAIGRARAGQDFRTILRTYYPGTTVGTIQ